jgi:DeoR family fructose operon transcriptional repressor
MWYNKFIKGVKTMLTEERYYSILQLLQEKKAVTVTQLAKVLNASESTIRRDLNALDEMGKLKKVHGGATLLDQETITKEEDMISKALQQIEQKQAIAKYAASLITDDDFVYLDAGTTTEKIIEFAQNLKATYVTNGIMHAKALAAKGCTVYLLGGKFKASTEAIVGSEALKGLWRYHFTKSFVGTNGVHPIAGFTTPDSEEAVIKEAALENSQHAFILADSTKFGKVFSVGFAKLNKATIITDFLPDEKYEQYTLVKEVCK